jgi:hypothetical protein
MRTHPTTDAQLWLMAGLIVGSLLILIGLLDTLLPWLT